MEDRPTLIDVLLLHAIDDCYDGCGHRCACGEQFALDVEWAAHVQAAIRGGANDVVALLVDGTLSVANRSGQVEHTAAIPDLMPAEDIPANWTEERWLAHLAECDTCARVRYPGPVIDLWTIEGAP